MMLKYPLAHASGADAAGELRSTHTPSTLKYPLAHASGADAAGELRSTRTPSTPHPLQRPR